MLLDSDRNRLRHMLDAAEQAISFAEGRSREDLDADRQFLFALIRCLEIVGEAAARVSEELREEQPRLPWAKMASTRNRLIHAYFDINLDIVWHTVSEELPVLTKELAYVLDVKNEG